MMIQNLSPKQILACLLMGRALAGAASSPWFMDSSVTRSRVNMNSTSAPMTVMTVRAMTKIFQLL